METEVKLGDRIVGKRTGQMIPSTVIGILDFALFNTWNPITYDKWEELYPDFSNKQVVVGLFDNPEKYISFSELKEVLKNRLDKMGILEDVEKAGLLNTFAEAEYKQCASVKVVAYPIDDVDII